MMTNAVEELFGRADRALRSLSEMDRDDAYAVSLFVYDHDDEPSTPVVEVSVNKETHVALRTPDASDADEARWNFAFWAAAADRRHRQTKRPEGQADHRRIIQRRGTGI